MKLPRTLIIAVALALTACGTILQPDDRPRTARQVLAAAEIAETAALNSANVVLPSVTISAGQRATLADAIINVSKAFDSAGVAVRASQPCAFAAADVTPTLPVCTLDLVDKINVAKAALSELQRQLPKGN